MQGAVVVPGSTTYSPLHNKVAVQLHWPVRGTMWRGRAAGLPERPPPATSRAATAAASDRWMRLQLN